MQMNFFEEAILYPSIQWVTMASGYSAVLLPLSDFKLPTRGWGPGVTCILYKLLDLANLFFNLNEKINE